MKCQAVLPFCVLLCAAVSAKVELPEGFRICSRNDPDLDECFNVAVNKNYHIIKDGVPSMGWPSIQKLKAPQLKVGIGNPAFGLSFNIELNGGYLEYSFDKFEKSHVDLDELILDTDVHFNNFTWHATHNTTGRFFLGGKFHGGGPFTANMQNLVATAHSILSKQKRDGQTYLHVDKLQLKLISGKISSEFDNIVPDKTINTIINKVLNENWEAVFSPLYGPIAKAVAPVFQTIQNSVMSKIPYAELFPEK